MNQNQLIEIEDHLLKWIAAEAAHEAKECATIHANTKLLEESVFDSMKLLTLVSNLEERFGIEIGAEDMLPTHFSTPRSIAQLVKRLQENQTRDP